MVIYQAIFLNEETMKSLVEKQGEKLPNNVSDMHITFKFKPTPEEIEKFSKIVGKEIKFKVIGYGSDGKNSGFEVELPKEISELYTNAQTVYENEFPTIKKTTPHITVSMANDANPVDTGKLKFEPLEEPFEISGIPGFFAINKETGKPSVTYNYDNDNNPNNDDNNPNNNDNNKRKKNSDIDI